MGDEEVDVVADEADVDDEDNDVEASAAFWWLLFPLTGVLPPPPPVEPPRVMLELLLVRRSAFCVDCDGGEAMVVSMGKGTCSWGTGELSAEEGLPPRGKI